MTKNQTAYLKFQKLLENRQFSYDKNIDIREEILSLTKNKVGFGLTETVLQKGFGANLPSLFPGYIPIDSINEESCDSFIAHGTVSSNPDNSHKGAVELFNSIPIDKNIFLIETSFLATTHSWIHSSREKDPSYACLGYVYDDIAHYFMADYPNRIIQKLNSDEQPNSDMLERARGLMQRIVESCISKYNAQPMHAPVMTEGYMRRVLVCDQAFADASTIYGKVDEVAFEKMLIAAIQENPDAEILVKTHPDSSWEKSKRSGYYSHLSSTGRVRLLREPANPYYIFDLVDKVYVGTSQMGLEALLAGKEVVCFGAPFYAGWGLTDDRQKIPHRHRQRSLEELFYYFYIWYTIYHVPGKAAPSNIEDALDYIEANRPFSLPPTTAEVKATPKVSVVIPVYGVEKYIEDCLVSVKKQTLQEIEIIPINDCSPDNSQEIIDRHAAEDPRIRPVILDSNIQLGMVRNRGIKEAKGKYIWFLDGDDWLSQKDMLRELYELAEKNGLDMARARKAYESVFDSEDNLLHRRQDPTEIKFTHAIAKTDFASSPVILENRHCWTWLYRRDFLKSNNIKFLTHKWEERAFLQHAFIKAKAIGLFPIEGPAYRVRANSISHRQHNERDYNLMLDNFNHTFNFYLEEGAQNRDHPLRGYLEFQLSEFVQHMLIAKPYRYFRDLGEEHEKGFIDKLRNEFIRCEFQPEDFKTNARNLRADLITSSAYPLLVAAVRANRIDLVRLITDFKPIPQDFLYELLLKAPIDNEFNSLQAGLSHYARNELVETAKLKKSIDAKKPRIIVHIGATKTGSTYLQHLMEKNRPALLRAGVWFPEVGLFWQPTRPHKQAGHGNFIQAAANSQPDLLKHIEAGLTLMPGNIHTVVLSSEAFFLSEEAHRIAEYFAGYPVEMVAYLRRQDEWANAQYCEFVAGGAVGRVDVPISEWLKRPETQRLLDYRIPLSAWTNAIGQENVKVRVFEKEQLHDNDLLADFAKTTKLPVLLDLPQPPEDNHNSARLSAAHVELIRLFNSRPFRDRNAYFDFIEEVTQALQLWRSKHGLAMPKPWVLSNEVAAEIMESAESINQEVATTYFQHKEGPLFGSSAPRPEPTGIYPEEIALIADAYERAKPPDTAPSQPERRITSSQTSPASLKIMNYGLFGWRYWLLTPLLALLFAKRATPELQREFLKEPAQFARKNWSQRRPVMTKLLYPDTDPMGPFQVFRIWVRLMSKVARLSGRAHLSKAIEDDPIRFARTMNNPVRRFIGRLMFPCGELR